MSTSKTVEKGTPALAALLDSASFTGIIYVSGMEMYQVDFSTNIPALFNQILN